MFAILSTAIAGLMMPPEQDMIIISTGRDHISPRYERSDYESACGTTVLQVRFRNGPEQSGLVEHVLINGRPVTGAAEILAVRAARRGVVRIEIIHCGTDSDRPQFRGLMELSEAESRLARLLPTLFFRITRQGREGWRLTTDD
jgi:hypothetical protein